MLQPNDLKQASIYAHVPGYGLQLVQATQQELVMGRAMLRHLEKLVRAYDRKNGLARTESKIFGRMTYIELGGRGRAHIHRLTFLDEENVFYYQEMRHALQIAIYGLVGETVALSLDVGNKSAEWRFAAGGALSGLV